MHWIHCSFTLFSICKLVIWNLYLFFYYTHVSETNFIFYVYMYKPIYHYPYIASLFSLSSWSAAPPAVHLWQEHTQSFEIWHRWDWNWTLVMSLFVFSDFLNPCHIKRNLIILKYQIKFIYKFFLTVECLFARRI